MDFVYDRKASHDDVNPYTIIDGPWGGMGNQTWFNGVDKWRKNIENVFELREDINKETKIIKCYYHRVWDNKKRIWRKLTKREREKFVLSDREYIDYLSGGFSGISAPQFKKIIIFPKSPLHGEIADIQPMNGPTGSVFYSDKK